MLFIKELSSSGKICKIYQIHKNDEEVVDSFLVEFLDGELVIHTRLFSSVLLAENRANELINAESITDDLLAGDL